MATMGGLGMFLSFEKGIPQYLLPGIDGLASQLLSIENEDSVFYEFNSANAQVVKSFIGKNANTSCEFFFHKSSPDAHAKSEKKNYLYVIANQYDTLYLENSPSLFTKQSNFAKTTSHFTGKISDIHYPEEVHKSSLDSYPVTIENSFRSLMLNDSIFVKIRNILALSIADYVREGKEITIEGWERQLSDSEINMNDYTIVLPKRIVIDGKTFENRIEPSK